MGTDDGRLADGTAVVDTNTKIYGTDNMFVVDASIWPGMPSTNPSALIVTAAERASDLILALPYPKKSTIVKKGGQCSNTSYSAGWFGWWGWGAGVGGWGDSLTCDGGLTCKAVNYFYSVVRRRRSSSGIMPGRGPDRTSSFLSCPCPSLPFPSLPFPSPSPYPSTSLSTDTNPPLYFQSADFRSACERSRQRNRIIATLRAEGNKRQWGLISGREEKGLQTSNLYILFSSCPRWRKWSFLSSSCSLPCSKHVKEVHPMWHVHSIPHMETLPRVN